jgi:hypothetical protein
MVRNGLCGCVVYLRVADVTDLGPAPAAPPKKVTVDLGNPCSALCTNNTRNLLAVVGRKGKCCLLW